MRHLLVLPVTLALLACGGDSDTVTEPPAPLTNEDFAAALNVDLGVMTKTATGLYVQDLAEGSGDPIAAGETASVHYEGWFPNGTKFDSSRDRNVAFVFQVGARRVIQGWDEGVAGMRVGGVRKLVIPPQLAYGVAGSPPAIPSNATLVFDIELLEITN